MVIAKNHTRSDASLTSHKTQLQAPPEAPIPPLVPPDYLPHQPQAPETPRPQPNPHPLDQMPADNQAHDADAFAALVDENHLNHQPYHLRACATDNASFLA